MNIIDQFKQFSKTQKWVIGIGLVLALGAVGNAIENYQNNHQPIVVSNGPKLISYTIAEQASYDRPERCQAEEHVVIDTGARMAQVEALLKKLYSSANGYHESHHERPTHVFIYVYESYKKAKNGRGEWVGMVSRTGENEQPGFFYGNDLKLAEQSSAGVD